MDAHASSVVNGHYTTAPLLAKIALAQAAVGPKELKRWKRDGRFRVAVFGTVALWCCEGKVWIPAGATALQQEAVQMVHDSRLDRHVGHRGLLAIL